MKEQITIEQIAKLAHDMVAAGNLNALYGVAPFLKAKKTFEDTLHCFEEQLKAQRLPATPHGDLKIDTNPSQVPEFLIHSK